MRMLRPLNFDLMSDLFLDFERASDGLRRANEFSPSTYQSFDFVEGKDHFLASFDLPGVKSEDVQVSVIGRHLTVRGERPKVLHDSGSEARLKFERTWLLPECIDESKIEAQYENGVLSLAIPKVEAEKPRTIPVQAGSSGFFTKFLKDVKSS